MAVGISNCLWDENTIKENTFKTSALRANVWGKKENRCVKKKKFQKLKKCKNKVIFRSLI